MSVCYSVAEGYGIYLNKLEQYLDGKNIMYDVNEEIIKSVIDENVFEVNCS